MEFVIPCNLKKYDLVNAFNNLCEIDWRQTMTKISVGDTVYIYAGRPLSCILYKCEVTQVNLPECEIDDTKYLLDGAVNNYKRYMRLKLVKEYEPQILKYDLLMENGLTTVQGPSQVNDRFMQLINSIN